MADYDFITTTGVIVADTGDLKTVVEQEFKDAFGADLDVSPNTPQGVLITGEVLARDGVMRNNATLANQINPNLAGGVFLDAIWALTGGRRRTETFSLIETVTVTGTPGATIPAGSQASVGAAGDVFASIGDVVLNGAGTGVVAFEALDGGPIGAPVHALDTIVSAVLGWETVDNTVAAVLGEAQESDQAGRARRLKTLAIQGTSLSEAILSKLYSTVGVISATFRENVTGGAVVIDGVNLAAHSVYACVDGGTDVDVAAALLSKKSLGAAWNGGVTVDTLDPASGQLYAVKFDRPTAVPIYMTVTIKAGAAVPDPAQTVRQAIIDYASGGLTGEAGFVTGGDVSPFEIASAINTEAVDIFVKDLQVGTAPGAQAPATIHVAINEKATIIEGNIAVIIV